MASRLIPSATRSICRPVSPAIPSVVEITARGTYDGFHLDTEAESPPSPSLPPSFHSDPEHYSPALNDDLRRPDTDDVEVPLPDIQAASTSGTDAKTASIPGDTSTTSSPSPPEPDGIIPPPRTAAPQEHLNVWHVLGRARCPDCECRNGWFYPGSQQRPTRLYERKGWAWEALDLGSVSPKQSRRCVWRILWQHSARFEALGDQG